MKIVRRTLTALVAGTALAGTVWMSQSRDLAAQEEPGRGGLDAAKAELRELFTAAQRLDEQHREALEKNERELAERLERERDRVVGRIEEMREHIEAARGERDRPHRPEDHPHREEMRHPEHGPAPEAMERVHALHQAAERLAQSGLADMAHELHQRAEMMEREVMEMQRHHEPEAGAPAIGHLAEQVEQLRHEVREVNHKLNRILELLEQAEHHGHHEVIDEAREE